MNSKIQRAVRGAVAALVLTASGACANPQIGDILGSILGGGQNGNVSGTVQSVDTRGQQIYLATNGQSVGVGYDNNTQVVYQGRNYAVTALENGDSVTMRVQTGQNGSGYYTDYVQVDRSINGSGTSTSGSDNVQQWQGTVRSVDYNNGVFTADLGNGTQFTVSLPYNVTSDTRSRFQSLRTGDYVRFYGVLLNNTRIELRQFL